MASVRRPVDAFILSSAGGIFTCLGLALGGGAYVLVAPQYYVLPFIAAGVMLAASALLYWRPSRHKALGGAIIVSSLAGFYPILREYWMFRGVDLLPALALSLLTLIGTVLGIVGGGLAVAWRPGRDLPLNAMVSEPGGQTTEGGSRGSTDLRGARVTQRMLRDPGRLVAFALLIASGLAMVGVGLWFWDLERRTLDLLQRYYGPPYYVFWVILGFAAIATSILLVAATRYRVAWGLVLIIVACAHSILVAVSYAFRSVTWDEAALYGMPGVLAVLGTIFIMTRGIPRAGRGGHRPL